MRFFARRRLQSNLLKPNFQSGDSGWAILLTGNPDFLESSRFLPLHFFPQMPLPFCKQPILFGSNQKLGHRRIAQGQFEKFINIGGGGIDFVQLNYSLAERAADRSLLGLAAEAHVAVIVNRPFAEGALFRRVAGRPLPGWAAEFGCASCF